MKRRGSKVLLVAICLLTLSAAAPSALAQVPDVALCILHQVTKWGTVGDITAYSVGTTSVNVGTANLNWIQTNNNHPVISQNMFRIKDGRIEHIGQSWLKHSFCALQISSGCAAGCPNQGGCLSFLAPGCQDPYSAPRNGSQTLLGPKWQVNPHTGVFPYPPADGDQGATGGTTYMRLQVHNSDLGDANAIYLVEGQYVAKDDATAGNQDNNASYRLVSISAAPNYNIGFVGGQATEFRKSAIMAWQSHGLGVGVPDPDVVLKKVQVPDDGIFWVAHKVSDNGDGTWHYEYAIQNMNSYRSARELIIPIGSGATISNVGFHDVDYHSGDGPGATNYDGTDWAVAVGASSVSWATDDDSNTHANALRWGTLYNFWFDADTPPTPEDAELGLYVTGDPASVMFNVQVPSDGKPCPGDGDGSGEIDVVDLLALIANWDACPDCPWDFDGNDVIDINDLLALLEAWGPCP